MSEVNIADPLGWTNLFLALTLVQLKVPRMPYKQGVPLVTLMKIIIAKIMQLQMVIVLVANP